MSKAVIVVPCYNEANRIDLERFRFLLNQDENLNLLFVDDGSRDTTAEILTDFARTPRVHFKRLAKNGGKAEAVRQGLLEGLTLAPEIIGYADADLATPEDEILRLLSVMRAANYKVLLASRVQLLGSDIVRKWWRHYLGRVFATFASIVLRLRLYDTQCGLKFFRPSRRLEEVLLSPFRTRWVFDVELIGNLIARRGFSSPALIEASFREVPLQKWQDVGGSKLGLKSMLKAGLDLLWLGFLFNYRRLRLVNVWAKEQQSRHR